MTDPNFPLYQQPPAKPKEPPRAVKILIGAVIGLGMLGVIAFYAALFVGRDDTKTAQPATAKTSTRLSTPGPTCFPEGSGWEPYCETTEPTTESASLEDHITEDDIELTVKIKSKDCEDYSTMADECYIDYKIDAAVDRTGWPKEGSLDVTYKVTGGNDGPQTDTLTMDLEEGTYEQNLGSTETRPGVRLKVKIIDMEYSEY